MPTKSTKHRIKPDVIIAFIFGVVFVCATLLLAIAYPEPTTSQERAFRTVLSLAAAGVASVMPGIVNVTLPIGVRAGGALAVFVVVYLFNPAQLIHKAAVDTSMIDSELRHRMTAIRAEIDRGQSAVDRFLAQAEQQPAEAGQLERQVFETFQNCHRNVGFYFTGRIVLPAEYFAATAPSIIHPELQDTDFVTLTAQRWRLVGADTPIDSASKTLTEQFQRLVASFNVAADPFVARASGGRGEMEARRDSSGKLVPVTAEERAASRAQAKLASFRRHTATVMKTWNATYQMIASHELVRPVLATTAPAR